MQGTQAYWELGEMAGVKETAFNKLSERVKALEEFPAHQTSSSWIQRHQLLTWLISLTLTFGTIMLAIYAGVMPHLEKDLGLQVQNQVQLQVSDGLKQPVQKLGQMSDDIAEIKGTLKAWAPLITPQLFKKTASLPDNKLLESLPQLKVATQLAGESKSEIPAKDIADLGGRLISLASGKSNTATQAWSAALDFLNYRSSTIVYTREVKTVPVPAGSATTYDPGPRVNGKPLPKLSRIPYSVAPKDAARLEMIGHNLNEQLQFGFPVLWLEGGTISLDNKYVRHVLFIGVEVHYSGAPITLEDAIFANCTFVFDNSAPSRNFGKALLASSPVNFQSVS